MLYYIILIYIFQIVENTEATWGRANAPPLDPAKDKIGNVKIIKCN